MALTKKTRIDIARETYPFLIDTVNLEAIPQELTSGYDQWVMWRWVKQPRRKVTKQPFQVNGYPASHSNPGSWSSFEQVNRALRYLDFDGIGFVVTASDEFIGIDLDYCRDHKTSRLKGWAQQLIEDLNSYTEISPSGRGIRIIIKGSLPPGRRRRGPVELYSELRFLTITGAHLPLTPTGINYAQAAIEKLHRRMEGDTGQQVAARPANTKPVTETDDELLQQAQQAPFAARFSKLWRGDFRDYQHANQEPDHSAADLALCYFLGRLTHFNPERIDRLFRQSGLFRPGKWDKKHAGDGRTYGQLTIDRALIIILTNNGGIGIMDSKGTRNRVELIGRVGQEPEIKTANDALVASFSLATNEIWKDSDKKKQERTEWHKIVAWRNTAELVQKYVTKGMRLLIEGRLRTHTWDDKSGQKRCKTEIIVEQLQFLDAKQPEASKAVPEEETPPIDEQELDGSVSEG